MTAAQELAAVEVLEEGSGGGGEARRRRSAEMDRLMEEELRCWSMPLLFRAAVEGDVKRRAAAVEMEVEVEVEGDGDGDGRG